jgi:3-oxoacyl-[acyl-carrier protein] reductase
MMNKEKSLAGQVAWITGSSRGLGRVMATHLCSMGASVAVHGTRQDSPKSFGEGQSMEQVAADIAKEAGGVTMPIWGDVTDEGEVKRMANAIRSRLGKIDILVTNAGGDIGAGGTGVGRGGLLPGSRAGDDETQERPDHHHRLHRWLLRPRRRRHLLRRQGRGP